MVFTLKEFHRSNTQDVCDILNLQEEVTPSIKDTTTYIQMSKEELVTILDKGKGIGVYVGDKLVSMGFWVDSEVMGKGNLKEEGYKLNLVSSNGAIISFVVITEVSGTILPIAFLTYTLYKSSIVSR